jgi:hypothetical protein
MVALPDHQAAPKSEADRMQVATILVVVGSENAMLDKSTRWLKMWNVRLSERLETCGLHSEDWPGES